MFSMFLYKFFFSNEITQYPITKDILEIKPLVHERSHIKNYPITCTSRVDMLLCNSKIGGVRGGGRWCWKVFLSLAYDSRAWQNKYACLLQAQYQNKDACSYLLPFYQWLDLWVSELIVMSSFCNLHWLSELTLAVCVIILVLSASSNFFLS